MACRMRSRDRRIAFGETSRIATEAMVNRTARKSSTGTRSSRSWIRKNVDPQLAVIASRARVARRVTREPVTPGAWGRRAHGGSLDNRSGRSGVGQMGLPVRRSWRWWARTLAT